MAGLGIMTTEFPADSLTGALTALRSHGVRTAQLQLGSAVPDVPLEASLTQGLHVLGPRIDAALAEQVALAGRETGVAFAAIDGTVNLVHPDRERRRADLEHLLRLIRLAPAMGSTVVTLCTGSRNENMWVREPANADDAAWSDLLEQLRPAVRAAEANGVVLAFEPEHSDVVDSAVRARRLIEEVGSDALRVLLDPANLFHTGDLARQQDHLAEAFEQVGGLIALAHAKDLDHDGAAGGRAAGKGLLDYPFFLAELQRSGFDGAIVLHGLHELDAGGIDGALDHMRAAAPAGYLD